MRKIGKTKVLLIGNVIIWGVVLFFFIQSIIFQKSFLKANEQLVHEFTSYQTYNEYLSRKEYLSKKMTPSVLSQVCPIIQVDNQKKEKQLRVTNMKTTNYSFEDSKITILVSFKLELSTTKNELTMRQIYTKKEGKWLMNHYNYI